MTKSEAKVAVKARISLAEHVDMETPFQRRSDAFSICEQLEETQQLNAAIARMLVSTGSGLPERRETVCSQISRNSVVSRLSVTSRKSERRATTMSSRSK